jgi:RNA polymerase sigma-70 factor (ECF subfamily)
MTSTAFSAAGPWPGPGTLALDSGRHAVPLAAKLSVVSEAATLVTRCREGDAGAFRELFIAHRQSVARLVFRMTGPSADIEDLVQEVFLQVHRSIADFRGDARFSTWLYRLTVNVVLMQRRAAKSRPQLFGEAAAPPPPDPELLPDEQVARRRRVAAFYRLVDRLSEKKRAVFLLHELEGLSPADIAEAVGAHVLTVRTRLFYARRELMEMVSEEPSLAGVITPHARGDVAAAPARGGST